MQGGYQVPWLPEQFLFRTRFLNLLEDDCSLTNLNYQEMELQKDRKTWRPPTTDRHNQTKGLMFNLYTNGTTNHMASLINNHIIRIPSSFAKHGSIQSTSNQ
ncbi:unnamed protein product [Rhodiola kirilowii]